MSQCRDHQLATDRFLQHINMKFFIAVLALAAVATADVSHLLQKHVQGHSGPDVDAQILRQDADVRPEGYEYAFDTSNGISAQESGQVKNFGREDAALQVQGSSQYTAPDGQVIQLTYVSNENGYQPQGAHLPIPPAPQPIPEYIQRSLDWIAAHPQKEESVVLNRRF